MAQPKRKILWGRIIAVWVIIIAVIAGGIYVALNRTGAIDDFVTQTLVDMGGGFQADHTINLCYDGYLGYAILASKQFKKLLRQEKIAVNLIDDGADYPSRMRYLNDGDQCHIGVMPIGDYLEQLGTLPEATLAPMIFAASSDSQGADAVVANQSKFPTIDSLKKVKGLKAAFTSKFMMGSLAVDADVPSLLNRRNVKAHENIEDTYNGLINGDYDVVGLWEPFISRAKKKGYTVLMHSGELKRAKIIDVFVGNRKYLKKNEKVLVQFLKRYFEAGVYYANNTNPFLEEVETQTGMNRIDIDASFDGIKFYTLAENVHTQFPVKSTSDAKILDAIDAIAVKLRMMKSIASNPIPGEDAEAVVYSKILQQLYHTYDPKEVPRPPEAKKSYSVLSRTEWMSLIDRPKFTRENLQIEFNRRLQLQPESKVVIDQIYDTQLSNYDYRIAVIGRAPIVQNQNLERVSQNTEKMAKAVYDYLAHIKGVDEQRMTYLGLGVSRTPERQPDQNVYEYRNLNNVVEILIIDFN